jgi:hypothetical protein
MAKKKSEEEIRHEEAMEKLRVEVTAISASVQKLLNSGIRKHVLALLIQANMSPRCSLEVIKSVIGGMETLDKYVFPRSPK